MRLQSPEVLVRDIESDVAGDPWLGFRRVSHVRVTCSGGSVRAEVVGVLHRHPAAVRVPLGTAARLAARGVPIVVRREASDVGVRPRRRELSEEILGGEERPGTPNSRQ